jgi:hypothetical protein
VHVAAGNFMLLDIVGTAAPADLYGQVPAQGQEHFWGIVQRNDELEKNLREKSGVVEILKRSLHAVRKSHSESTDDELDRGRYFFGEQTTEPLAKLCAGWRGVLAEKQH